MKKFILRLLLVLVCAVLLVQIWIFTSLAYWRFFPVESTMFMRTYYWTTPNAKVVHEWKDSEDISDNFKRAVITAEDGRFLEHNGFDWAGIEDAIKKNEKKGEVVAGGSTISQQLAKNLFLFNKRSYLRKGQEAVATWMMERMWSKARILEVYVNSVEFGEGIYGIEAATQHYYGKSAKSLTKDQAAQLASMLPNPRYYQDHDHDGKFKARKIMILRYMKYSHLPN